MTIDEANTKLATASTRQQRATACRLLAAAACAEVAALEFNSDKESEGYALITHLVQARNTLEMVAQYLTDADTFDAATHAHRAIDQLDKAKAHITMAIETL